MRSRITRLLIAAALMAVFVAIAVPAGASATTDTQDCGWVSTGNVCPSTQSGYTYKAAGGRSYLDGTAPWVCVGVGNFPWDTNAEQTGWSDCGWYTSSHDYSPKAWLGYAKIWLGSAVNESNGQPSGGSHLRTSAYR